MLERILEFGFKNRALVAVLALVGVVAGVYALVDLPVDAFPDTTPVQVQVNTVASALNPEEVERQITFPIETAIGGLHTERLVGVNGDEVEATILWSEYPW